MECDVDRARLLAFGAARRTFDVKQRSQKKVTASGSPLDNRNSARELVEQMIETQRLNLRLLSPDDAAFILGLLNQPSWLRFIGDKGVRTLEDARRYIEQGPMTSYRLHGFGLWLTELKAGETPIGLCGLIKRDSLPDVDIGFAFAPEYWGQGYASEAALATLNFGCHKLGLRRIVAITAPDNQQSIQLLQKIGLTFEQTLRLSEDGKPTHLFSVDFHD